MSFTGPLSRGGLAPYLFSRLAEIEPLPASLVPVSEMLEQTAFFPGGCGLWLDSAIERFPDIMVVGQDFSTFEEHRNMLLGNGRDLDTATWRNFRPFAAESGLDLHRCFFTNALMGLRASGSSLGANPAYKKRNQDFVARSHAFLQMQVAVIRPKLILVLGLPAARVFSACSAELAVWANATFSNIDERRHAYVSGRVGTVTTACVVLTHPSFRHANVGRRRYKNLEGHAAELALVREALSEYA